MIFVDASAIVALATGEREASAVVRVLSTPEDRFTSAVALYEATLAAARIWETTPEAASLKLERILREADIVIEPLHAGHGTLAVEAFTRFGKGRGHPAQLNMGDCFAYAATKLAGASILFVGNDFSQTDLPVANAPGL
jgi:ribonuclease VapC